MKTLRKNGGFTLVELIVVIAILAILAGVAVPAYSGYIKKANSSADLTVCDAIKTACVAATVDQGTVTKIVVTDGTTDTVEVYINGAKTSTALTSDTSFLAYYGQSSFSVDFKQDSITTATWEGSTWEFN